MKKALLTFRAGICDFDEETKIITPIQNRGLVTITKVAEEDAQMDDGEEGSGEGEEEQEEEEEEMKMYDFHWSPTEMSAKKVEPQQYMLLPGENVWKQIESCKDGRVFALIFSSGEKKFFWLQEKSPDGYPANKLSNYDLKTAATMQKIINGEM